MTRSTSPATSARRPPATLALVAALVVLLTSLLAGAVSAAPRDDIVGTGDDPGIVVDDPTQTPLPEPTPVAIPSVSPEPTRDPNDVTGDLPEEVALPDGPSDLHFTFEVCNSPVPGQISDLWCGPDSSGYEGQVYAGTQSTYTEYYFGPLPVDLIDIPAGPYLIAGEPAAPLTRLTLICRVEDGFGNLIITLTGKGGAINLSIGNELVYRCTMYQLPDGELPDEMAPDLPSDGPVELVITDYLCPAGTDPALNYFGLIGRCPQSTGSPRYEARNAGGAYFLGNQIADGVVTFPLTGGAWTITNNWPTGDYPPIFFCNVRDELYQEPPQYAPFMTYTYGADGAVMTLEQNMTWLCAAYHIPAATGTGEDVAQVTTTIHACPEGTTTPTIPACAQTLPGVTVHLLYGTQTIVATKQTDTAGKVTFAAPENLGSFGLAEAIPAGYTQASTALCSKNGAEPVEYAVDPSGVLDLGGLVGGDAVSCSWFNIADPTATAPAALDLEVATDLEDLEIAPVDETGSEPQDDSGQGDSGQDEPQDDSGQDKPQDDSGQDKPQDDSGEDATPTETPESGGIVPLEEDE